MKKIIYKLLLTADTRGETTIYKEFVGHKVFLKEPDEITKQVKKPTEEEGVFITETKHISKTFIKTIKLYDADTKQFRKQKVWLRVVDYHKGIAIVEVF